MFREMMKSKIHRATVTHADLHYVGSITIDRKLMGAANLQPNEKVDVVNVSNGARLSTYVIEGIAGSGVIGINGAAARLVAPGDIVIIIAYAMVLDQDVSKHLPSVVFVDSSNRALMTGQDPLALPVDAQALFAVTTPPLARMSNDVG